MEEKTYFQSEILYELPVHKEFSRLTEQAYGVNTAFRFLTVICLGYFMTLLDSGYNRWLYLVLCCVIAIPRLTQLRKQKKGDLAWEQTLHRNNGEAPRQQVVLDETGIRSKSLNNDQEITDPYDQVTCLMESENLLCVMTKLRMIHLIDKRTLTGGSREALLAHLRQHCPKLKKKIRTGRLYAMVEKIMWVLMVVGLLLSLSFALQIPERLAGQLTNDLSYGQMSQELADLDILISPDTISELEQYASESEGFDLFAAQYPKVLDLLCLEGMGRYNSENWQWTPSASGVYWFDMEATSADSIYTDFLTGIDAMSEDLSFTDITEDYTDANPETGRGDVVFSFVYLGQRHELEAEYNFDWFDTDMLYAVGRILADDEDPRDLWMTTEGQGILLYYGTEEQMQRLEKKTGLFFFDCVIMRMGH